VKLENTDYFPLVHKLFGFPKLTFAKMLSGEKGIGKQLLAEMIKGIPVEFLHNKKNNIPFFKPKGFIYLTEDKCDLLFEFRAGTIKKWKSEKKVFLRECLLDITEPYAYNRLSMIYNDKAMLILFPNITNKLCLSNEAMQLCNKCFFKDFCNKI